MTKTNIRIGNEMNPMKILNLYAGIGGNRKLWGGQHEITAVEINPTIASIYQKHFPNDKIVVGDAHMFLLENIWNFDFIWSSPPCPTHSRARKRGALKKEDSGEFSGQNPPAYPDMKLYEEILLLQGWAKCKWVVENVISWYQPLIPPFECGRHYFWSNFHITNYKTDSRTHDGKINELEKRKGFDISKEMGVDKVKILRNCVEPELGLHVLNEAFKGKQERLI